LSQVAVAVDVVVKQVVVEVLAAIKPLQSRWLSDSNMQLP
jgi:hypothetical protein